MKTKGNLSANITYQKLIELHRLYLATKHPHLTLSTGKEDTRSIWFELNSSMRAFLNEVLTDSNVSGLRVYLCAYKDKVEGSGSGRIPHRAQFVKQLTIGFVTTTEDEAGRHVDYPTSSLKENKSLVLAPPQNHGELCPDVC